MADDVSKTGVFIDTKTGKVVEAAPEEGIQLVAPGGVVSPDAKAQISAAKAAQAQPKGVVDLSVQEPAPAKSATKAAPKPPEK